MLNLFDKHNLQYRRPVPYNAVGWEKWLKVPRPRRLLSQGWHIEDKELKETSVWNLEGVAWTDWFEYPCSMVLPCKPAAVGANGDYLVREVTTINFPALCWLLGDAFTAEEIEAAWFHMPLVHSGFGRHPGF